jgi:adenosylhomocysteine nucleosidase
MDSEVSPQAFTVVVLISADAEWRVVRAMFPDMETSPTPFGDWFAATLPAFHSEPVVFFHGGWGKIAAAASTQHAIDRWHPDLLVNLGTCGGFAGLIEPGR